MDLARDAAWRLAIIAQYLGLSLAPILPLIAVLATRSVALPGRRRLATIAAFVVFGCGLVVAPLIIGSDLSAPFDADARWPWPALGLPWLLPLQLVDHPAAARAVDLAGICLALALVWIATRSVAAVGRRADLPFEALFLGSTAAVLVALHLVYVQLNDTYIVSLAPFALLLVGLAARAAPPPRFALTASIALSALAAVLMALWIRADHAEQEAAWRLSDDLVARGVPASDIATTLQWHEYHGAFDAWIAAGAPQVVPGRAPRSPGFDDFHDPFYAWQLQHGRKATFLVRSRASRSWCVIRSVSYRSASFTPRQVSVYVRAPRGGCPAGAAGAHLRKPANSSTGSDAVH